MTKATQAPEFKFEVVKKVTLPILQLNQGEQNFLKISAPIVVKETEELDKEGKMQKKEISIANVVELQTGEEKQIVVSAVLSSILNREYPENTYAGKAFIIEKGEKKGTGAKAYYLYNVTEISV